MTLSIKPMALPTGGAIAITFTTSASGNITLERSPYPNISYTTLYTGPPLNPRGDDQYFLDLGDGSPGPLLPTTQYIYQLIDETGSITSDPLMPVSEINLDAINWDQILIGLLQGAINVVKLPPGVKPATVVHAMPLTGLLPMPFVVVLNELDQQDEIPIGQSNPILGEGFVQPPYTNVWTQTGFGSNTFRISVFSQNAIERRFYRDLIIATFRANLYYVFQQLGSDIVHRYQAISYQAVKTHEGDLPGFYACDVMLEFTGTQNITMYTSYGLINEIDMKSRIYTYGDPTDVVTDEVVVPNLATPNP